MNAYRVNWLHPLNYKRAFWALAVPGNIGGRVFPNICSLDCQPVLNNNMTLATDWSAGQLRPGGFSHIKSDTIDGGLTVLLPEYMKVGWPITLGYWYKAIGLMSGNCYMLGVAHNNSDSDPYICYSTFGNASRILAAGYNSGGSFGLQYADPNIDNQSLTSWIRIIVVFTSSLISFYFNGVFYSSASVSLSNPTYSSTASVYIHQPTSSRNPMACIDDCSIWHRALNSTEILQDYYLSSNGYPDVLHNPQDLMIGLRNSKKPVWWL